MTGLRYNARMGRESVIGSSLPNRINMQRKINPSIKPVLRRIYDGCILVSAKIFEVKLYIKSKHCGLFGDLAQTLNAIRFAEINDLDFEIDWDKNSLYFDSAIGKNVWYYFFKCHPKSFRHSRKIKIGIPYYPTAYGFPVYTGLSERQSIGTAIQRYCTPRPEITKIIEDYVKDNFSENANLGVHYRCTDVAAGFENRAVAKLDSLQFKIKDWIKNNPNGRIFLASDDARAVEFLKERYCTHLHSRECIRSKDGNSIHGHYDGGILASGYDKGVDVIVDANLLSRCDQLLHQGSRVAWFARAKSNVECLKINE